MDAGAMAMDVCEGDVSGNIVVNNGGFDAGVPGTYIFSYSVVDGALNVANLVIRTVTVSDNTIPVITLTGNAMETVECGGTYMDAGAMAMDVCDGDISGNIVVDDDGFDAGVPGTYTYTYNVMDGAGNAATEVTRTVTVSDNTGPVITLTGNATETVECGGTYMDAGAMAADACEGDVSGNIVVDDDGFDACLLYTSPSPRDLSTSRMPSSA